MKILLLVSIKFLKLLHWYCQRLGSREYIGCRKYNIGWPMFIMICDVYISSDFLRSGHTKYSRS